MPISQLTTVGLAKEVAWGTGLAPTQFLPVTKHDFHDEVKRILDEGKRGVAAKDFGAYTGVKSSSLDYGGDFFPDVPPFFLLGILGQDGVTGVGPYTHLFTLANIPPSLTIYDYYAVAQRQFAGAQVEEIDLKWGTDATTAIEWAVKLKAMASATTTLATPTIGTMAPLLGWQAALTIGGAANLHMLGGDLSLKRPVNLVFGANNSQVPSAREVGPLEVTGKLLFYANDESEILHYLNNDQPIVSVNFTSGANQLTLQMSKCDFEDAKVDRGSEYVRVEAQLRAHYNAADAGPCKITVINSVASY